MNEVGSRLERRRLRGAFLLLPDLLQRNRQARHGVLHEVEQLGNQDLAAGQLGDGLEFLNGHGLAIEMKVKKGGVVSDEQKRVMEKFRLEGWQAIVCHGADEAIAKIEEYLG